MKIIVSILLGALFGAVLIFSEAFHWYRIQEMFHFKSFHMFGLLGTAILTGFVSVQLIKRYRLKSIYGNEIAVKPKPRQRFGNLIGGLFFGAGWALTGACTAPLLILVGYAWQVGAIAIGGALIGVLLFGLLKEKLPE